MQTIRELHANYTHAPPLLKLCSELSVSVTFPAHHRWHSQSADSSLPCRVAQEKWACTNETHAQRSQLVPSPIFSHFRHPFNQHGRGKKLTTKLIKPGNHVQVNVTEINCQQLAMKTRECPDCGSLEPGRKRYVIRSAGRRLGKRSPKSLELGSFDSACNLRGARVSWPRRGTLRSGWNLASRAWIKPHTTLLSEFAKSYPW